MAHVPEFRSKDAEVKMASRQVTRSFSLLSRSRVLPLRYEVENLPGTVS